MLLWNYCLFAAMSVVLSGEPVQGQDDPALAQLFKEKNVDGTVVLASLDGATVYTHNTERAARRYCPASTFKIPNTLIAIDSGVLADETQVYRWDGKKSGYEQWDKDQSLTSAFAASCVWFYQEIARHLDLARYAAYLKQFDYGSQQLGQDVTTFWLDNSLQISALEEVGFLRRLVKHELGVKEQAYEVLRRVMRTADLGDCAVWAKTGWAMRQPPSMGWYVGYVEAKGATWLFAMNMDIPKPEMAAYRQELALAALVAKGICAR